jgi:hypothetical protein
MFITSDMFYLEPFLAKGLLNREIVLKKTRRHAEFISIPRASKHAKVCNRQVGDLAGVNILWDAEINSARRPLFNFRTPSY